MTTDNDNPRTGAMPSSVERVWSEFMFDTRTKQAVWRGSASGTVPNSPEKVDAAVTAGLDKMFANFPPGSGSP